MLEGRAFKGGRGSETGGDPLSGENLDKPAERGTKIESRNTLQEQKISLLKGRFRKKR